MHKIIIEAFKTAEIANFTDEEYKVYEDSLMIMRDNINVINTAKEEGREEGRIEGREEGKIEERKEIAIEMLKDKEPIDKIIKYSKLNEEEILKLKKKLE